MGVTAVATRSGGIPEMFAGNDVILVNRNEFVKSAPRAIINALVANSLLEMGIRAQQRFRSHLNWDTIADRMVAELETAVGKGSSN
jgi:glycosyltransferase involved in cell wall biosynthesis